MVFEGATDDAFETTISFAEPTADRTHTLPNASGTIIFADTTDTLTNKTIALGSNTISGTLAQFNSALTDDSFASLTGTETLTNKTFTAPTINVHTFSSGTTTAGMSIGANGIVFEGATADAHETTLTVVDPTQDNTITIPDASGTIVITSSTDTLTNKTIALGSNTISGTTSQFNSALSDGSFVSLTGTETLTNKTLTSPTINSPTITTLTATQLALTDASIVFEGATADAHETTLTVVDPTADRTITLPNETGTLITSASAATNAFSIALAAALG